MSSLTDSILTEVKTELGPELPEEMKAWSYQGLLAALGADIDLKAQPLADKTHRVRDYAQTALKMRDAGQHKLVRSWLRNELDMSKEQMILVLRTLVRRRTEVQTSKVAAPEIRLQTEKPAEAVINHVISTLNSLHSLMVLTPGLNVTIHDGHRMAISGVLQQLTRSCGIQATFAEPPQKGSDEPVTRTDLKKMGI